MCGINGIVGLEREKSEPFVSIMNKALAHRGPDNDGIWVGENVALGHRRLSVIDLSSASNQPMIDPDDNLVLVYNGELYNYQKLKNELTDYSFRTNSDSEVVLAAYKKWGGKCLQRFNGMYAFAVYNKSTNELFIGRDRIGIKPLYYYYSNNVLVFSSEIRALLGSGIVPRKLNKNC
ncbi:MAG: asparagine synthetase B, partial [Flavobacteriales bacterium]|nr:asparagine synthetase B [Flavobacteriales bacterium]